MRKRSKWMLTGIGIVVVALGTMYGVALSRATARLREAYAALEKDGRPMRLADVTPEKVPDEQNAALLYAKAASMLKTQPAPDKNLLKDLGKLSGAPFRKTDRPEKLAEQEQDVAKLKQLMSQDIVDQAIATVEQGTQRPACQFADDYDINVSLSLPIMEDMRDLIRVLGTKLYLETEAGHVQKAWDLIPTLLRFADAPRNVPGGDNHLARMAMIGYSCATIRRLCETAPPDEEDYKRIEGLLTSLDDAEPLIRAIDAERLLLGERLFSLPDDELFEALRRERWSDKLAEPGPAYRLKFRFLTFKPRFIADHASYLQMMRLLVRTLQGPFVSRDSPEYKQIDGLFKGHFVTQNVAPFVWGVHWIHCRTAASVRITLAGLALLRYKQGHGAWPSTLDALDLKGLTDPFTQQSLLYRPEGKGFIVYSVDDDRKDNGGITEPLERRGGRDIVWRFPEPS
ncbi:MAG: hypothetical protein JW955_06425 [Sedimentisphaerales bacterium]|nr:hypothetical protein [Sedimentisphaerales bacterium]